MTVLGEPLLAIAPLPLVGIVAAGLLYARACSILSGRSRRVRTSQIVSFYGGLALILLGTQTFVDTVGETSLVSMHMLQHMLIADISAPFLLYGVRAPVLYFFWPKPVLVFAARRPLLRRFWAWLRQPVVALSTWLVILFAWHIPVLYQAALEHWWVHDLEHISFAFGAILAWWPLMDPTHERVQGQLWKAAYVTVARMVGGVLGIVLIASRSQLYPWYGDAAKLHGISPITDQQLAGSIMMAVDFVVVVVGFAYFVAITAREEDARSVERGESPAGERLVAVLVAPDPDAVDATVDAGVAGAAPPTGTS